MSYLRGDSICDVRIFSFFILILCFCKYTEKNFMGFEYASIKLLFPDPRCRLHLFLRRLRLNAASLPVVAACCWSFSNERRSFFKFVELDHIFRTKGSLWSRQSQVLHLSWIPGLPALPLAPTAFGTAVSRVGLETRGLPGWSQELCRNLRGESEKLLLIVFCRLKCLWPFYFDAQGPIFHSYFV